MININQLTSQLAKMPDGMLQKFASMHKDDPYTVALALSESNRRKDLRSSAQAKMAGQQMPKVVDQEIGGIAPQQTPQQLPEEVGIGQLPAQNIQNMAAGGIVAFEEGGEVPRFQNRGEVQDPFRNASRELTELILATAAKYNIDPSVAMRLVKQESGFDPNATSKRGAVGLTQLMPAAAKDMGLSEEDRFDPVKNVNAGFGYLRKQLDKYGNDYSKALSAYNWGGSNLDKHLAKNEGKVNKIGLPKETADYLTKILPMGAAGASELPKEGAAKTTKAAAAAPAADNRPWYDRGRELMMSGEAQKAMLQGVQDVPASLVGAPVDLSYYIANKLGRTPVAGEKPVMGSKWIQEKLENMGMRAPDSANPDLRAVREATTGIAGLYNPFGKAEAVETGAQAIARRQAEKAAEAEAKVANPRLAGPTTDSTMVQGAGYAPVVNGRAVATQVADKEAAAAEALKAQQAAKIAAESGGARQFTNTISPLGVAAATPGIGGLTQALQPGQGLPEGAGSDLGKELVDTPKPEAGIEKLIDASKGADSKKGGLGDLFNDPMFIMGMNMMASQNPRFLGATGEAGLGTAKYMAEQRKEESERAYKEALAKHYGVDPFVQRLRALQDPENMRMFNLMKEAEGEPALMRELVTEYLKNPAGMSVLKTENPALYNAIRMQASRVMAPRPMNELPGASAATRPPV